MRFFLSLHLLLFFLLLYGNKNETEDLFKKYFFQSKIRKKKKNTFHAIGGITSFYNFSCELKKRKMYEEHQF